MARVKKSSGSEDVVVPDAPNLSAEGSGVPGNVDASATLIEKLEEADKQTSLDHSRAIVFESVNAALESPIDPRFMKIVERQFAPMDWDAVLSEHEAWMELGDRRTEEAFIRKAHEIGPALMRKLYGCYIQIRFTRESWEKDNDVLIGTIRAEATKALQREKDRGVRNKTITEADIIGQCAQMFPDEWPRQEQKRLRYKLTEDGAKHAVEEAVLRCKHLDTMMARLRM
jgi:hypothetical protein